MKRILNETIQRARPSAYADGHALNIAQPQANSARITTTLLSGDGPSASHPGASLFGAYGGLSCLLATELTRQALFEALRRRHHYATTGCRMLLETRAEFSADAECFDGDPNLGPSRTERVRRAMMGDGLSSYNDGIISAANELAAAAGVKVGMSAKEAARILVDRVA